MPKSCLKLILGCGSNQFIFRWLILILHNSAISSENEVHQDLFFYSNEMREFFQISEFRSALTDAPLTEKCTDTA